MSTGIDRRAEAEEHRFVRERAQPMAGLDLPDQKVDRIRPEIDRRADRRSSRHALGLRGRRVVERGDVAGLRDAVERVRVAGFRVRVVVRRVVAGFAAAGLGAVGFADAGLAAVRLAAGLAAASLAAAAAEAALDGAAVLVVLAREAGFARVAALARVVALARVGDLARGAGFADAAGGAPLEATAARASSRILTTIAAVAAAASVALRSSFATSCWALAFWRWSFDSEARAAVRSLPSLWIRRRDFLFRDAAFAFSEESSSSVAAITSSGALDADDDLPVLVADPLRLLAISMPPGCTTWCRCRQDGTTARSTRAERRLSPIDEKRTRR
jgi:hypothetical protein